jgi:CRP/FNR family cyclic AMP-dependent transcriptional regulator
MPDEMTDGKEYLGLATNPLFRQLSADALEKISGLMVKESKKAGDAIFLERERGDALYVLESGKVRIWVRDGDGNDVTLSELEP